ncbi:hypothetical protein HOLleu_28030 [Holothuria leucospilota]|uniref:Ig-like domain-containing protein n=1 Tax=Holothuria leucospilota TaxID=206669 RepID=A0A9Q1BR88_HOLLE|nr:hypothetical protein HOLleu_28030 [Holothuria leucospilota]
MDLIIKIFVAIYLLCVQSFTYVQPISFGLTEANLNAVIFAGEENIVLRCEVFNAKRASIQIVLGKVVIATNNETENVVEHIFPVVTLQDSGYYTCLVTFFSMSTGKQTLGENFHLVVHTTRPQCVHSKDMFYYQVGETVELSCFCLANDDCKWDRFHVGDNNREPLTTLDKRVHSSKSIVRSSVGPLSIKDNSTTFVCYYGPSDTEQCLIGPLVILPDISTASSPENDVTDTVTEAIQLNEMNIGKAGVVFLITAILIIFFFVVVFPLLVWVLCKRNSPLTHRSLEDREGDYAEVNMNEQTESNEVVHHNDPPENVYVDNEVQTSASKKESVGHYEIPRRQLNQSRKPSTSKKRRLLPDTPYTTRLGTVDDAYEIF